VSRPVRALTSERFDLHTIDRRSAGPTRRGPGVSYRIAVIAGDGVGPEVVGEARKAVDALGLDLEWRELDWGTRRYHVEGAMMPPDALDVARRHDAVLLGAVGDPSVPDHVTLWGLLLPLRQGLDLWANLRPARLLPGVPSPLAGDATVDMLFVRENTEGEYSGVGGRAHRGLELEVGIETSVFTRAGVRRVIAHAFELAADRRGVVTSATKSNASRHGYVLWDEIAEEIAAEHPGVRYERVLVDALAARMIGNPAGLDVVVASNLFGDILTDVAAALQGGMGMAASANVAPGSGTPGIFEPVHGSAPDIAGRGIANPIGAIWSAALMLDDLGEREAGARLLNAIESVCRDGPRTRDLGGGASTSEVGDAVAARV
jgi:tartrate dehydrogenase/decarboxylase/D-malate dehydrogenase